MKLFPSYRDFEGLLFRSTCICYLTGNPIVQFDNDHRPDLPVISLGSNFVPVMSEQFYFSDIQDEMLQLTNDLSDINCDYEALAGAPDKVIVGVTTSDAGTEYWIHTTSFELLNNEIETPLLDGGKAAMEVSANAPYERMQLACSSAPRTFLNEEQCVMSESACHSRDGEDVMINLNVANLEKIYTYTGGIGGEETRYVYIVGGLMIDNNSIKTTSTSPRTVEHPCTAGAKSRWAKTSDCNTSRVIQQQTRNTLSVILSSSNDVTNPTLRDIYFPTSGTLSCHPDDVVDSDPNSYRFKIVDSSGQCWENTHPDNYAVYDFTEWAGIHVGKAPPIKNFADVNNAFILFFPVSYKPAHSMDRWEEGRNSHLHPAHYLGRAGDNVTFTSLPKSLITEAVAQAFDADLGVVVSFGKVMVCGSPFEVSTNYGLNSGILHRGTYVFPCHRCVYFYQGLCLKIILRNKLTLQEVLTCTHTTTLRTGGSRNSDDPYGLISVSR
jgi:hypothetical protein